MTASVRTIPKLAVIGDGKMGKAIASLAADHGFEVVPLIGEREVEESGVTPTLLAGANVAVEFTVPDAAARNVRACVAAGCPVVCGTTGWEAERAAVEADVRAAKGALLWAPNFSIGVHLFTRIAEYAARLVADAHAGFDAHIIEMHHSRKLDAPSGTARSIADRASREFRENIPITSVRTGNVPGTHQLIFDGAFEQIRLEHIARDRRVFAAGALVAARWLIGRQGVFTLDDMLGTTDPGVS
jgi:4-hydroxy-tetrahydrodipicolinate reductase